MSTEKSLLTWEIVKDKVDPVLEQKSDTLVVPVGVDDSGNVHTVQLTDGDCMQHMCIIGRVGSGRTNTLHWILAALQRSYRNQIIINYIDGRDCEVKTWIDKDGDPMFYHPGVVRSVEDYASMYDVLTELHARMFDKGSRELQEVIVFDDVDYLVRAFTHRDTALLQDILRLAPSRRVHIIYASQRFSDPLLLSGRVGNLKDWSCVCITKASEQLADILQCSDMAAKQTRKYGDLVVKNNSMLELLHVPLITKQDILKGVVYV
ncbi:MAG: ATP-binding protein [Lachnospiraceae bacterium]|nr:ATP-binding protein [Lachnospiraceae bacterium]